MDFSKLTDKELEAISSGDLSSLSDKTLRMLAGETEKLTVSDKEQMRKELFTPPKDIGIVPGNLSDLPRQLGLTARAAITGATALPAMGADALTGLINLIAGKQVMQPSSQALQSLMTQAGVPEPKTAQERVVQDIGGAMAGAAAPVGVARGLLNANVPASLITGATERGISAAGAQQATRDYLSSVAGASNPVAFSRLVAESPALQGMAAAGGAIGGGLARESDLGPVAQTLAAITGSIAPGGVTATQALGRGAKEAVRPFTEAGREVITGNVLRSLARDPEAAIKAAESYQARVPGYQPTTSQATRDLGLISAETPIRSMASMGQFEAQASAANQARLKILDQMAKDKTALEGAIKKRDEVTAPLREQAFANPVDETAFNTAVYENVLGKIDAISASDVGARKTVQKAMDFARQTVEGGLGSPTRLYEARKDLRDAAQGLLDKEGSAYSLAKKQLEEVIRAVDDAIESGAPGYKDYLQKYATSSRGIERLEAAQEFRGKVLSTTPDPSRVGDFLISQPAFTRAIRAAEKDTDLSKTQLAVLKRVAEDLDSGVLNRAGKVPGSDTFKNLSTANIIGGVIGKQMFGEVPAAVNKTVAPLNWLYNGTDDQIRELLVSAMLDPKLAADLMKKANVMTVEPLSQALKKKAIAAGYGASFGLTE